MGYINKRFNFQKKNRTPHKTCPDLPVPYIFASPVSPRRSPILSGNETRPLVNQIYRELEVREGWKSKMQEISNRTDPERTPNQPEYLISRSSRSHLTERGSVGIWSHSNFSWHKKHHIQKIRNQNTEVRCRILRFRFRSPSCARSATRR